MIKNGTGFLGPLPGGGPWLILDHCRAEKHNTLRAAEGWKAGRRSQDRCVCPRAAAIWVAFLEERRKKQAADYHRKKPADKKDVFRGTPVYVQNVKQGVDVPNLQEAPCRTDEGRFVMDNASESRQAGWRNQAVELCLGCKVMVKCAEWVLAAEDPPGSWGGVYAAMTTGDRRREAERRGSENERSAA
jgi:hypothetical protein